MIDKASQLLDVKADELSEFTAEDSFNSGNILRGVICRKSDHRYGALVIFRINDEDTQQIIWATPKLDYPFDRAGNYHWPSVFQQEFYEKLDGTNVLSFWYIHDGKRFVTYKTRLTPVIKDSGYSPFKSMWEEYLMINSWVKDCIENNPEYNLSFELFGNRNPITIQYDFPLDVNLLFGIRKSDHTIRPPSDLRISNARIPSKYTSFYGTGLTEIYNHFRKISSMKNREALLTEGVVMYAHTGEPSWRMFKCKPEEIEKIHWAASGTIPRNSLFTTGLNVFESYDNPDINDFLTLLREEYPQELLTKNTFKIQRIWNEVRERMEFVKTVNNVWKLAIKNGFDVTEDKRETMRFVSQYFPKNIMSKVGGVILKQAGLLNKGCK